MKKFLIETQDGRADMTNFEMDLFDTRCNNTMEKDDSDECCKHSFIKPACLPITILAILLLMTFFIPLFNEDPGDSIKKYERTGICTDNCRMNIVESIPTGLKYKKGSSQHTLTFDAWQNLLKNAEKSIDMAVFYWNLRDPQHYSTSDKGYEIFNGIVEASERGVKIRIAQNSPSLYFPSPDSEYFQKKNIAEVRSLNFTRFFGSGVLHTKFWIVDQKHVYIGSANMDWKSITEVKEIGALIQNCSCIASELSKIFKIYWRLGLPDAVIPPRWPVSLRTNFDFNHPLQLEYNSVPALSFISNSPGEFNPKGREHDLNAIIGLMNSAIKYVRVAVMDYLPTTQYMPFWPDLDNAIRSAAYRGLTVELMISQWNHTKKASLVYLKSLLQINDALPNKRGNITIKLFIVPSNKEQQKVPFIRVNHQKFMVTDKAAYIGTSNWVGDYFINTAGVGFVVEGDEDGKLVNQYNQVFLRDWESEYAVPFTLNYQAKL